MAHPKKTSRQGVCKLTLRQGQFVNAHILPKTLTRAEGLEPWLIQGGRGQKKRRFSSWYDQAMVIEEGEAVLAEYDNHAIAMLRHHQMVWSGWGPRLKLSDVHLLGGTRFGVRTIELADAEAWGGLRLFFLSLLWRAATTTLEEFNEVQMNEIDLEKLRQMILDRNCSPQTFYPITLTQISTLGLRHNHSPVAQTKIIPAVDAHPEREEPFFRFFIDGLIVHFSRLTIEENEKYNMRQVWVGASRKVHISTVEWADSLQLLNLKQIMLETAKLHNSIF